MSRQKCPRVHLDNTKVKLLAQRRGLTMRQLFLLACLDSRDYYCENKRDGVIRYHAEDIAAELNVDLEDIIDEAAQ